MKRQIWRNDWAIGSIVVLLFILLWLSTPLIRALDSKAYDWTMEWIERSPSPKIAVIGIDQVSLDNLGRWPWSRDIHAQMIDKLKEGGAAQIVSTIFFTEPQRDRGLDYLEQIQRRIDEDPAAYPEALVQIVNNGVGALQVDRRLADSIKAADNVILPMMFNFGAQAGDPSQPLPDFFAKTEIEAAGDISKGQPRSVIDPVLPVAQIGAAARAVGAQNLEADEDGVLRSVPLGLLYYDAVFPTFYTHAVAKALNVKQMQLDFGRVIHLGALTIETDPSSQFQPHFYSEHNGRPAFSVDSFYDVFAGKIPSRKYAGQIVLIGTTAPGIGDSFNTPVVANAAPLEVAANTISALLEQHYYRTPAWSNVVIYILLAAIAIYILFVLPRLKAKAGAATTAVVLLFILGTHYLLMSGLMIWIPLMAPASLLLIGHLVLTTKRFLITEEKGQQSAAESAESNRMLGLAFQNQGQLDMAFDKLRRVPLDEGMMEIMYNLALDFERKRQFNKAESVYRLIHTHDPKYRDLAEKMKTAKHMAETVILGGGQQGGTQIMLDGEVAKPMLGRYQLEKELGKGAMGIVYLGKDPKISREVAIKTMSLGQEFDEDVIDEARERFFREAETAGRLNHPNIVTIFDAGEEHDLAYIAMEFLAGEDLTPYTKVGHLLPVLEVITIVRQIAQALDYAHQAGVVHRDIKPANVMYDKKTKTVKVTDFGIARITDSSKTKTGMVLGTPSFMSPEQLAGKHIDGRSDLFSLGVMLYQMLTGYLPFVGDSMAELMYRITQQPPTDPRNYNPKLPSVVIKIIMKALEKKADQRFQTGAQMANVLLKLEEAIKGAANAKPVSRT